MKIGDFIIVKDKRIKENGQIAHVESVGIGSATVELENKEKLQLKFKNMEFMERKIDGKNSD
jgi:hypothetical protein